LPLPRNRDWRRTSLAWILALVVAAAIGSQWLPPTGSGPEPSTATTPAPTVQAEPLAGLPAEEQRAVRATLTSIEAGGPFPYVKDGSVFQNRERRLPTQANGYYREYTVETPGSPDRGARRIVAGRDGELFYTSDHYDSFIRIN